MICINQGFCYRGKITVSSLILGVRSSNFARSQILSPTFRSRWQNVDMSTKMLTKCWHVTSQLLLYVVDQWIGIATTTDTLRSSWLFLCYSWVKMLTCQHFCWHLMPLGIQNFRIQSSSNWWALRCMSTKMLTCQHFVNKFMKYDKRLVTPKNLEWYNQVLTELRWFLVFWTEFL